MRAGMLLVVTALVAGCGGSDVSRAIGARCDVSEECDDRCLVPADGWPGGFCTLSCDDDGDCVDLSACTDDEGGVCLFTCSTDENCEFLGTGWGCRARPTRPAGGEVMVCVGI